MALRQEKLFPMQDRRIGIFRIVSAPRFSSGEVNRYRLCQDRVRIGLEGRIGEKRQLQLISPKLHQIEVSRDLIS